MRDRFMFFRWASNFVRAARAGTVLTAVVATALAQMAMLIVGR